MQTLTYGFYKPQTGDKGSVFFPDLESNFQQLNDHTHNGSNSSLLTAASSAAVTQALSNADWASQGGGMYRQTASMPAGTAFDTHSIELRNAANGRQLLLSIQKVTSTSYYVYINDNTLNLTAVYA